MSNETPTADADELPDVDEVLASALTAHGAPGVRALGLLRDARRILTGALLDGRRKSRSRACEARRTPC